MTLGNRLSRSLQKWTGINLATSFILSRLITCGLRFKLDGKVTASIKTYSLTDAMAGKFKSAGVKLTDASYNDIPLGNLVATTTTPVWIRYISSKSGRAGLRKPILVKLTGELDKKNVSAALETDQIANKLSMIKLDLPGLGVQYLQFDEPEVDFTEGRIEINSKLITRGASPDTAVVVKLSGKPNLVDRSKIIVDNLAVESSDIIKPDEFAKFASELLNPLFDLAKLDSETHAVRLDNLDFSDHAARFSGNLILAPKLTESPVKNELIGGKIENIQ